MHHRRVILMQKMQIFSGRGHSPLPRPLPQWGGGHPTPHTTPPHTPHPTPLGAFGASILTPPVLKFCLRYWDRLQVRQNVFLVFFYSLEHFVKRPQNPRLRNPRTKCIPSVLNITSSFFSVLCVKFYGANERILTLFRKGSVCRQFFFCRNGATFRNSETN